MSRLRTSVVVGLAVAALTQSCVTGGRGPTPSAPAPVEAGAATTPPRPAFFPYQPRRILLMANPKEVRRDHPYPPVFMRQRLVWTDTESEWRMTFPARRYAYGSLELRKPLNLATNRDATRIQFRFRPAALASFLSIALVDSPSTNANRVLTDFWLFDAGSFSGDGWVTIEIPLTNFPSEGLPVGNDPIAPDLLASHDRRPFNWGQVSEIRFVSNGGQIPHQEVTVRDIQLRR